jgi:long-chain acyl-CoA synthetase
MPLFTLFERTKSAYPTQIALIFKDTRYSYADLIGTARDLGTRLLSHIPSGAVVGIFMDHSDEWVLGYLAALAGGFVVLPMSLRASDEHLRDHLAAADVRCILTSDLLAERCGRLCGGIMTHTIASLKALPSDGMAVVPVRDEEATMSIFFTSGTTGTQKGVMLSHRAVTTATNTIANRLGLTKADRYYALLPLYHSFGLGNVHATLLTGGTVVVGSAGTNVLQALDDMRSERCTFFAATPLTLTTLATHFTDRMAAVFQTLRVLCTNTGPIPPETVQTILTQASALQFFTYYGLTEASRSSFQHFNEHTDALGSVGTPPPGVEIAIRDGEVCIRGPHLFTGYLGNEALTRERVRDGWLFTGDMGRLDDDGRLYVLGRKDDMVDIGGERFTLQSIDEFLRSLPGIRDAAAFVRDGGFHPHIVACVVPDTAGKEGEEAVMIETLLSACRKGLDRHQAPARIICVPEIPKTESGKIRRNILKERYGH